MVDPVAGHLFVELLRVKRRLRTGHRPRQGQGPNDGEQCGMIRLIAVHVCFENELPASNSPPAPCVAFRNRSTSDGVLLLLRAVSQGMTPSHDLDARRGSCTTYVDM